MTIEETRMPYEVGDFVLIDTDDVKGSGVITHIDYSILHADHMRPIQVELDEAHAIPDTMNRQTAYRVNLKELSFDT